MEARLKLKPGQYGTKKLLVRFGERLVCVRYRYVRIAYDDIALRPKMKTLGALWRPRQKLWEPPWGAVQALGIEHRVISNTTDKPDKPIPPTPDM